MSNVTSVLSYGKPDHRFVPGACVSFAPAKNGDECHTMVVDPSKTYQPILGFGSIWTETDTYSLLRMSREKQDEALHLLFDPETGAGWNFMRLPFGSTDWDIAPHFYTYDDMPPGEKDWELEHFSIQKDIDRGVFDIARRAKEINPDIVYFASVWGLPAWMKESDTIMYSRFDVKYADVYARYLTKAVLAFKEQGIDLYAVSPQNESLTANDRATPATLMPWWIQKEVVIAMRREFDKAGLQDVRIWPYDHNFNMSDYFVKPWLEDPEAKAAITGVAFHDYGGSPFFMRDLYEQYPDIEFYMTERTILTVHDMDNLVRELRSGTRSYANWTTISDEFGGPHVYRGVPFVYDHQFDGVGKGRLNYLYNLKNDPDSLHAAPSHGIFGMFSKYIKRGMVRVDSTYGATDWLTGTAFLDEKSGEAVMVVVNQTKEAQPLTIRLGGEEASFVQDPDTVAAYRFEVPSSLRNADAAAHVGIDEINGALRDYPIGPKAGTWDICITDIKLNGPAKAGEELPLSVVVRNDGDTPTTEGAALFTQFKLDGDNIIGQSFVPMPVLNPGDTFEAAVNVPVGMPYVYQVNWKAEAGHHQIFAFTTVSNDYREDWTDNNVFAKEFDFA